MIFVQYHYNVSEQWLHVVMIDEQNNCKIMPKIYG